MVKGNYYFPKSVCISLNCLELLVLMIQDKECDRISIEELADHPYITGDDFATATGSLFTD